MRSGFFFHLLFKSFNNGRRSKNRGNKMKKFKRDVERAVSVILCVLFLSSQTCFAFDEYMAGPPSYAMEAAPPEYQGSYAEPYEEVIEARNAGEAESGLQTSQVEKPMPVDSKSVSYVLPTPPIIDPFPKEFPELAPIEENPFMDSDGDGIVNPDDPTPFEPGIFPRPSPPGPPEIPGDHTEEPPAMPPDDLLTPPTPMEPTPPPLIIDFPGIPAVSIPPMTVSVYFEADGIRVYYDIWTWDPVTRDWTTTTYEYFFPYPHLPPSVSIPPTIIDTDGDGIPDMYEIPPDIG